MFLPQPLFNYTQIVIIDQLAKGYYDNTIVLCDNQTNIKLST